jgi:hypothetical protein
MEIYLNLFLWVSFSCFFGFWFLVFGFWFLLKQTDIKYLLRFVYSVLFAAHIATTVCGMPLYSILTVQKPGNTDSII